VTDRIRTYDEFWPYYLREHSRPETRNVHFAGTAVAVVSLAALFVSGNLWFILVALVSGYAPAWFAHFFIEQNRPATFRYPFWSLISDFRMAGAWVTGGLDSELDKAGIAQR
jgi:hypothetical protein